MNDAIQLCGWTLFHSFWQGAALVALAALIGPFLKAETRYRFHGLVLLGCLLAPLLTALSFHEFASSQTLPFQVSSPLTNPHTPAAFHALPDLPLWLRIKAFFEAHINAVVAIWALGATTMTFRMAGGHLLCRSWKSKASPADANLQKSLHQLTQRLGITRVVNLLLTHKGHTPDRKSVV